VKTETSPEYILGYSGWDIELGRGEYGLYLEIPKEIKN